MNPLTNKQISTCLNTLLYDNLDLKPTNNHMTDCQQQVERELQKCQQDLIECKQSSAQLNSIGLFCKGDIRMGSRIGPYNGQTHSLCEYKVDQEDYWEIYEVDEHGQLGKLSSFFVGSKNYENWMQFVRYARNRKEQNLEIVQFEGDIFFQAVRDIKNNEELLVWYSDSYDLKFGVPSVCTVEPDDIKAETESECATPTPNSERNGIIPVLKSMQPFTHARSLSGRPQSLLHGLFLPSEDGPKQKVWKCIRCTKTFISSGSLRAHARIHTGEKPYTCSYCQRSFCQMSTLRSHIRLHTGEKPFKCDVCHRSFTQSAGLRSHKKTHKSSSVEGVFIYSASTIPQPNN